MHATTAPIAEDVLRDESRRRATTRARPISWRRALRYALLCSVAMAVLQSFTLPVGELSWREMLPFTTLLLGVHVVSTIAMAWLAIVAEPRMSAAMLALSTMAVAIASAAVSVGFALATRPHFFPVEELLFAGSRSAWTQFAFDVWLCLFYGGLFMLGFVLVMRAERTRSLLGNAEVARSHTETVLSQTQLQALRGQVDPDLLLRVMAEVQRRYAADPAAAERMLDQLVNFLRSAMPGLRSGRSTLAAELAIVQSYVQLWAELDPQRAGWRIHIDAQPLPDLPLPPLLLLPVLDQLSGRGLSVRREADRIRMSIDGPVVAGWLPTQLAYRLRVGLRAEYGEACALNLNEAGAGDAPALLLSLPIGGFARSQPAAGTPLIDLNSTART